MPESFTALSAGSNLNGRGFTWCVNTEHRGVRDAITELCGGQLQESAADDALYEILLGRSELDVFAASPDIAANRFVLATGSHTAHVCDGQRLLEPVSMAKFPCGCPTVMVERKAAARLGRGPSPRSSLTFRLREAPKLGSFSFDSDEWSFSEQLGVVGQKLASLEGEAILRLSLEVSQISTRTATVIAYTRPGVVVVGQCSTLRDLGLAA